jgi:hypothetical protein
MNLIRAFLILDETSLGICISLRSWTIFYVKNDVQVLEKSKKKKGHEKPVMKNM